MVAETLICGLQSARNSDKIKVANMECLPSEKIGVPGLAKAIANVEMVKQTAVLTGDHILVIGRAVNFRVRRHHGNALPLLSVGPNTTGYQVLAHQGIHRIGTVTKNANER